MKIDKKLIKELTQYLDEFNLTELEYANNEIKIKVSKASNIKTQNQNLQNNDIIKQSTSQNNLSGKVVKSPIIGTAYLAPEPGGKKFTDVGKKIKKGDTVMIVEAMKTMNHVPSPFDGTVKEICVADGSPVEFDQVIAIID
ncbi:MAG: acetyl-CoA carboxylase biotin carboxyl carrier protein subunit [Candidatus Pelagibacter sp.]|nr:acetyl-CoA carboxylase biotin carboxyl carrier protein subunit [Candidatus Pelagibacter sp.]|tara:strand:+ start:55 stop:477 length:423 start_codon:yes stop_codon:yes gene_type:complete